jgi:hypothetical protein
MTRVLFWNIENFALNKIFSVALKRQRGHGGLTDAQAALARRTVINAVNAAAQADIIVIVEVSSGDNWPNALASQTGGMEAMVYIQNRFNNPAVALPGGWGLVPPLYTGTGGRAETVGILYRRTNNAGTIHRYFTGPNIWTGGYGGASADPGLGLAPAAYPAPVMVGAGIDINAMLVPPGFGGVRAIPGGAQHNAGLNENVVAARIAFDDTFGAPIAFGGLREPFMATFTETNAGGVVQRNLTIFGIHSPPQGVAAANYHGATRRHRDPDHRRRLQPQSVRRERNPIGRVRSADRRGGQLYAAGRADGGRNPGERRSIYRLFLYPYPRKGEDGRVKIPLV